MEAIIYPAGTDWPTEVPQRSKSITRTEYFAIFSVKKFTF